MGKDNKKIDVLFLMQESCQACKEVLKILTIYMKENDHINFTIIDLDDDDNFKRKHSSITPSIWVNNNMWYAGGIDINKFDKKITKLISKTSITKIS